jgi:hypothetical protein
MIKLDVVALMRLTHAAAQAFADRGHGAIIVQGRDGRRQNEASGGAAFLIDWGV